MDFPIYNITKNKQKINLLDLNYKQLRQFFISIGEKPFCADQVMHWIYNNYCVTFEKMTNISHQLKKNLTILVKYQF